MTGGEPTNHATTRRPPDAGRGYDILRLLVAAVLLVAAGMETYRLATEPPTRGDLFLTRWAPAGWVEAEIFLGVWLVTGVYRRAGWAVVLACFGTFCGVTLAKGLRGEASCGCFGAVPVNPWYTFVLDAAVVTALLTFRPKPGRNEGAARARWRAIEGLGAFVVLGAAAGLGIASGSPERVTQDGQVSGPGRMVLLRPQEWPGKGFPLLTHMEGGGELARGRWVVMLFRKNCLSCREAMPRYRTMARAIRQRYGAGMAMVELARPEPGSRPRGADADGVVWLELDPGREWFVTSPTVAVLSEGVVEAAWEGAAPEADTLLGGPK
ncbi:MAG: hypothetical protein NTV86_08185 [Planctomycetota bacterium]|nr:hypothetical protein [Planctomycetota bacterium]